MSGQLGEVPEAWKKVNATPVFPEGHQGGPGELQAGQSQLDACVTVG